MSGRLARARALLGRARHAAAPPTVVLRASGDPARDEEARRAAVGAGLACVLSDPDVVRVPDDVRGLVVLAEVDDRVQPDALAALAAAVRDAGVRVGRGAVLLRRGGRVLRRTTPDPSGGVRSTAEDPSLLGVLGLGGVLVEVDLWREVVTADPPWDGTAAVATRLLLVAGRLVTTADVVVVTEEQVEPGVAVEQRRRHRPERLAVLGAAAVDAARAVPAPLRAAHAAALVRHHLRDLVTDALAGSAAGLPAVAGLADVLVDRLEDAPERDTLTVEDRLLVRSVAGASADTARWALRLLEEHPHGLPHVAGEAGDDVLDPAVGGRAGDLPLGWRRLTAADRRLRVRLLTPEVGDGVWRLDGDALVTATPDVLPEVVVDGVAARVARRDDPTADLWAAREHEDHAACGFRAEVDLDALPAGGPGDDRVVEVTLAGRRARRVAPRPAEPEVRLTGLTGLTGARAGEDRVVLAGTGAVAAVRLHGPRGTGSWEPTTPAADGSWTAAPSLRTTFLGEESLLPAGSYRVQVHRGRTEATGDRQVEQVEQVEPVEPSSVAWVGPAARPEAEVVGERWSARPQSPDRLLLGAPVHLADDAARARRRRMNAWTPDGVRRHARTVVLESFAGRSVADNPLAIGRELARRDREEGLGLDLVWLVDDPSVQVPPGTRAVARRTPEMFEVLAEAAAYVSNASSPAWWRKRPGMVHLQTWHGIPLKRIGEDRGPGDFATWRHREVVAAQAADWDLLLSPSPWCTPVFRSAFRYAGRVLEAGQPRNDVLLGPERDEVAARVRTRLGLGPDDHVVLYAPTWRDNAGDRDAKPVHLDVRAFGEALPGTTLLIRGHYNATRQPDLQPGGPGSRVLDVTRYPDVADLLCAADALVTDYSSTMFDYSLLDRPVVLLVPDLAEYRDVHPGTYVDIETRAPGPVVADTASVVAELGRPDGYSLARTRFVADFSPLDDGSSARRVVDSLLDLLAW